MPDFQDDPSIPNDTEVWRRITPRWIKFDPAQGRRRPSSEAFQDSRDRTPLSVFLAAELSGPDEALEGHDGYCLAALNVGFIRTLGLGVSRHPIRGEDPPGHAWVVGPKTKKTRNKLARNTTWVVGPDLS